MTAVSDNTIRRLPKDLQDQIAAGEVVERPLSVVKELTENAVDAGAKSVTVEISKGGKDLIRVSDDGCGIAADQIELAFTRYATSKIREAEDLGNILTLGFRGEALASIASVSHMEMLTKRAEDKLGSKICISGGETEEICSAACREGATLLVRDLFYNLPARKKFLKSDNIEAGLINSYVSKMAIAYPGIRFRLINNGSILFSTLGNGDLKTAIMTVYSPKIAAKLLPVNASDGVNTLRGYIGAPSESLGNRRYQIFFVNGRWINSRLLENAVASAYSDKLFEGRYPAVFLFLDTDPAQLDVNIHPNKTEIKFSEEESIKEFTVKSLRNALLNPDSADIKAETVSFAGRKADTGIFKIKQEVSNKADVPPVSEGSAISFNNSCENYPQADTGVDALAEIREEASDEGFAALKDVPETPLQAESPLIPESDTNSVFSALREKNDADNAVQDLPDTGEGTQQPLIIQEGADTLKFRSLNYIGTVFSTYILCGGYDAFYIIDQHAAHERILFEKLMASFDSDAAEKQIMLLPQVLDFSASEIGHAKAAAELLCRLGFTIEEFGAQELVVKEVPAFLGFEEAMELASDVLYSQDTASDLKLKRREIISRACKAAVKSGDRLDRTEVLALLAKLDNCENPYTCPHGRPTFVRLREHELEKLFKRK